MMEVLVCPSCARVLPPGARCCPACGGPLRAEARTGAGRVLAATELTAPAAGWTSPHRMVVFELDGGGEVLALSPDGSPAPGTRGRVERGPDGLVRFTG